MEVKESVTVVKGFEPDLPEVPADGEQIRRVMANLIKNADDAMPDGGQLKISGKAVDGFVELRVEDTGQGISEADLAKVFDPLFTTKAMGIGLGPAHSVLGGPEAQRHDRRGKHGRRGDDHDDPTSPR